MLRSTNKTSDSERLAVVSESEPEVYKISGRMWDRMVEKGIFDDRARLELVDGEIVKMSPIGYRHSMWATKVRDALLAVVRRGFIVVQETELKVGQSRLYPDALILRGSTDDYMERKPVPADTPLVVEVERRHLSYIRGRRSEIYAEGGV